MQLAQSPIKSLYSLSKVLAMPYIIIWLRHSLMSCKIHNMSSSEMFDIFGIVNTTLTAKEIGYFPE